MSKPFNLDAVKNETGREPFPFVHGGETFTLPAEPDLSAAEAISNGRLLDGLHRLMGDKQFEKLVANKAMFTRTKMLALLDAYGDHVGVTSGKSSGSTGSSKSTAGPSKRTSNGSTKRTSRTSSPARSRGAASRSS